MTKDVIVTVRGLQSTEGQYDTTEVTAGGQFFIKAGKYYLLYEEFDEEGATQGRVTLKLDPAGTWMEMSRKGPFMSTLRFEPGESFTSIYMTPFGELNLTVRTDRLSVKEAADRIEIEAEYVLEGGGSLISENQIRIEAVSTETADGDSVDDSSAGAEAGNSSDIEGKTC